MASANVRFWDNNWLIQGSSFVSYSSATAAKPGANATNDVRSIVWSPSGNFEIHGGNDTIYYDDGGSGSTTLTHGNYSASELATEIATQLNAVSSGWSASYSSGVFNITNSTTTYELEFSNTTDAVWDTLGYTGSVDTAVGASGLDSDEPRYHTSEYVQLSIPVPQEMTAAALIAPIGEALQIPSSATVFVRANNADYWESPDLDLSLTRTDRGIFGFLESPGDYLYWRVGWSDPTNPNTVNIGRGFLGTYQELVSSNVGTGFQKQIVDPSGVFESDRGARFGDEKPLYQTFAQLRIAHPTASDRAILETIRQAHGITKPLFVSIDPAAEVSTDIGELTAYCHFEQANPFTHIITDRYDYSFGLREAR